MLQNIDYQCHVWAVCALEDARVIDLWPAEYTEPFRVAIIRRADRIIAARAAQVAPDIGASVTVAGDVFTVRRTEQVRAYGRAGWRVFFDLNGRRVYSPMSLTEWNRLTREASHGA